MADNGLEEQRKVGSWLGLGIFFMPYIFAWFTLRNGYSAKARFVSVGWALWFVVGMSFGFLHKTAVAPVENRQQAEAALAQCPAVGTVGIPVSSARRFRVNFQISIQGDPLKPVFVGRTNLPSGTKFLVTLRRPTTKYMGQSDATVTSNGCFSAGPFSQHGDPLNGGSYSLELDTPSIGLQPVAVRAILGDQGQNMSGPSVEKRTIDGSDFGKTVHYKATFNLGPVDAAKDQAVRTAAEAQEEKRFDSIREQSAILAARTLRRNLRNPASADWVGVGANRDGSVVCIVLRALNGFGGMNVDNYVATDDKILSGSAAWNKYCAGQSLYDQTRLVRVVADMLH